MSDLEGHANNVPSIASCPSLDALPPELRFEIYECCRAFYEKPPHRRTPPDGSPQGIKRVQLCFNDCATVNYKRGLGMQTLAAVRGTCRQLIVTSVS